MLHKSSIFAAVITTGWLCETPFVVIDTLADTVCPEALSVNVAV